MFSLVRFHNSGGMMEENPVLFHSVMMSIMFLHYKQLMELAGKKRKYSPSGNLTNFKHHYGRPN